MSISPATGFLGLGSNDYNFANIKRIEHNLPPGASVPTHSTIYWMDGEIEVVSGDNAEWLWKQLHLRLKNLRDANVWGG